MDKRTALLNLEFEKTMRDCPEENRNLCRYFFDVGALAGLDYSQKDGGVHGK